MGIGLGHTIDKNFLFNLNISKQYSREGEVWKPEEPDLEELEGEWVILEFNPMIFVNSVFGLVGESSDSLHLGPVIDLSTLQNETNEWYDIKTIYKIFVLESPAVSFAKDVIKEVEDDSLEKSLEPVMAIYAHVIKKLKDQVSNYRVAELINYLMGDLRTIEEGTEEADILGKKLAGGPSKSKEGHEKFIKDKYIEKWVTSMQEKEDEIDEKSIEHILAEIKGIEDDDTIIQLRRRFIDWISVLKETRDPEVDQVIRKINFDIKMMT